MDIEVWYLSKTSESDKDGAIVLFLRELSLVIEPKFDGWREEVELYNYKEIEAWQSRQPKMFTDGYEEKVTCFFSKADVCVYTYLGNL